MGAMVLRAPGREPTLVERPVPTAGPGQLVARVLACGVCRADLHVVDGDLPDIPAEIVPGHEVVARVRSIGDGVVEFARRGRGGRKSRRCPDAREKGGNVRACRLDFRGPRGDTLPPFIRMSLKTTNGPPPTWSTGYRKPPVIRRAIPFSDDPDAWRELASLSTTGDVNRDRMRFARSEPWKSSMTTQTDILGGVFMAHAPQFFTLPETEDRATVERIRGLAQENGRRLAALEPDVTVVVANDHANQFLLHCVPAFMLHRGAEARGTFAGREFVHEVAHEAATKLVRHLQAEGFDPAFSSNAALDYAFGIPLDFLGFGGPILPVYVNAYIPPQPAIERCYAFGQALARGLAALGLKAVVVASGGLSHFPGTDRYAHPDIDFDRKLMAELESGNLRWLLSLDPARLDATGNIELRCWAVAAGMLGERKPDLVSLDPSWHHDYATLAWWSPPAEAGEVPHYPEIAADRVALSGLLHALATDGEARARYLANPAAYGRDAALAADERAALLSLDEGAMRDLAIHPFLPFMARLQLDRQRGGA